MIETDQSHSEAIDIIGRIMAEMEEVFGLINRPRGVDRRRVTTAEPDLREELQQLAA